MKVSLTRAEVMNALLWQRKERVSEVDLPSTLQQIQDGYGPLSQESWAGDVQLKGPGTDLKLATASLGALKLQGQLDGRNEQLTLDEFAGEIRARGTHQGATESLSVDEFGGDLRARGTHLGKSEDLVIDQMGGDVRLRGTHKGLPVSLSIDSFGGWTRVRGTFQGAPLDVKMEGERSADQLLLQYLTR